MENTLSAKKRIAFTTLETFSKKVLHSVLAKITYGQLTIIEGNNSYHFGDVNSELKATIQVHNGAFYQKTLFSGSIGVGESFIDGDWTSPNTTQFIYLFAQNLALVDNIERYLNWLLLPINRIKHLLNKNSIKGSKKNIVAHYDLGNQFYQLFLDKDMLYSSAIYPDVNSSLNSAQQHKLKLICERLDLQPGQTLLEIGTGWGALAIYAAKNYHVKVTTTTISDAQYQHTKQRIDNENLSDQITLLKQDYRKLTGQYDRVVSIEMIEAVGHEYMAGFFRKINALVKPCGRVVIQAITIADQRYNQYRKGVDFIQKYIFPGGCLPSISVMNQHLTKSTDLVLWSLTDLGQDYAKTLAQWRENFQQSLNEVKEQGFSEQFIRMWFFYLHYCEAGFLARATSAVHFVAVGPNYQASNKLNN